MFTGFSPEAIDFLWGIRLNNEKPWFEAHKNEYLTHVYRPMQELGEALYQPFREIPGMLLKVSRIYKDARYSNGIPYKDRLWICIRREVSWWSEHPALFFELRPDGASYGFLLWQPKAIVMANLRHQLTLNPKPFLELVQQFEAKTGCTLTGTPYAREKQAPSPEVHPFFQLKGLEAIKEVPVGPSLFSSALADEVREFMIAALPLNEYLNHLIGQEE